MSHSRKRDHDTLGKVDVLTNVQYFDVSNNQFNNSPIDSYTISRHNQAYSTVYSPLFLCNGDRYLVFVETGRMYFIDLVTKKRAVFMGSIGINTTTNKIFGMTIGAIPKRNGQQGGTEWIYGPRKTFSSNKKNFLYAIREQGWSPTKLASATNLTSSTYIPIAIGSNLSDNRNHVYFLWKTENTIYRYTRTNSSKSFYPKYKTKLAGDDFAMEPSPDNRWLYTFGNTKSDGKQLLCIHAKEPKTVKISIDDEDINMNNWDPKKVLISSAAVKPKFIVIAEGRLHIFEDELILIPADF